MFNRLPKRSFQKRINGTRRRPSFETLQPRELMAIDFVTSVQPAIDISAEEQLMIELVNRARANPGAEAARYGIDLNAGLSGDNRVNSSSKAPLAPNAALQIASALHSTDMLIRDYFAHDGKDPAPNGKTPSNRAASAGYNGGAGENLSLWPTNGRDQETNVLGSHQSLFESPGHRSNMLTESYKDIGVGIETGDYSGDLFQGHTHLTMLTTEKFGLGDPTRKAITGVVFNDTTVDNDFYNLGEGVSGMEIIAIKSTGQRFSTVTGISGGYALQVPVGSYQVYASNGAKPQQFLGSVELSTANVKLDMMTDRVPATQQLDANRDGVVSPLDALMVINFLNQYPAEVHPPIYPTWLDVNQNGFVESTDVLMVINELNRKGPNTAEGPSAEAEAKVETISTPPMESSAYSAWASYDASRFSSELIRKSRR